MIWRHWKKRKIFSLPMIIIVAVVLAGSFIFTPGNLPAANVCYFKAITKLPCPACGMTRSFSAISHGEFSRAWDLNPFGYVMYAFLVLFLLLSILDSFSPVIEERLLRQKRYLPYLLVLFLGSLILFGIYRLYLLSQLKPL